MIIRNVKIDDATEIKKLCEAELEYQTDILTVENQINYVLNHSDEHHVFIAEIDHKVVGFVHVQLYNTLYSKPAFNVLGLAINHNYQHQGIGKFLMDFIESLAVKESVHEIRLNSGIERVGAHRFYESIGYVHNKDQARYGKELTK